MVQRSLVVLLLLLLGAVLLLAVEIRYEHHGVLGEAPLSWVPVYYLIFLALLIPVGIYTLKKQGAKILAFGFTGLIIVGALGFSLHSKGHPVQRIQMFIKTLATEPGGMVQEVPDNPDTNAPPLAPLSLIGLGAMGLTVAILLIKTSETQTSETQTPAN